MNKIALTFPALLFLLTVSFETSAMAGNVPESSQAAFNKEVLESNKPVVVDFFATWCGPCQKLAPVMESLSKDYADKVSFYRIDVDKNPELANKYQISGIPAVMIFREGKVVDNSVGLISEAQLNKKIAAVAGGLK